MSVVQDPCENLDGGREAGGRLAGGQPGQHTAATEPFRPRRYPLLGGQIMLDQQLLQLGPELPTAGPGRVTLGGQVPQRSAGQLGHDGGQAAPGRARAQADVELHQAHPGRAGAYRPPEQAAEPIRAVIV